MLSCRNLRVFSRGRGCILTTHFGEATEGLGPLLSPATLNLSYPPHQRTDGRGPGGARRKARAVQETT